MMKVQVIFEAEGDDCMKVLREQMMAFLGAPKLQADARVQGTEVVQNFEAKVKERIANAKAAKAKKASEPEPQQEPAAAVTEQEPEEEPQEEPQASPFEEEPTVTPEAENAIQLHKLKETQLSRLRELFNTGKGPLVRQLLAKYGNGAKVFPEVDASQFPAIKIELDKALGA